MSTNPLPIRCPSCDEVKMRDAFRRRPDLHPEENCNACERAWNQQEPGRQSADRLEVMPRAERRVIAAHRTWLRKYHERVAADAARRAARGPDPTLF